MKNEGPEKSGRQLVPEKQIFSEIFEVISQDAKMCMQLFSCRVASILEGSPSLPAAGAGVRPESRRLPKREKAAHAKTGNKPL